MSNLNIEKPYVLPLLISKDYYVMTTNRLNSHAKESFIMTHISIDEEAALDKGKTLIIERGNAKFTIFAHDVRFYGKIDFNLSSDDCEILSEVNWFRCKELQGFWIPGNYDYKHHVAHSDIPKIRWYDTTNGAKIMQYVHGVLDKPERVIIFRKQYNGHK